MNKNDADVWIKIGGAIAAFYGGKMILEKLGLIKSKDEVDQEKLEKENLTSVSSAFSPNYYKSSKLKGKLTLIINFETAKISVEKIRKAVTGIYMFDDDEEAVYAVFRGLKAKTDVSRLSEVYSQITGKDLFGWLKAQLSEDELRVVSGIVYSLPDYR